MRLLCERTQERETCALLVRWGVIELTRFSGSAVALDLVEGEAVKLDAASPGEALEALLALASGFGWERLNEAH